MHDDEFKVEREILPIIINTKEPLSSIFILNRVEDQAAPHTIIEQYLSQVKKSQALILLLDSTAREGVKNEVEEARKYNIPIYAFIRNPDRKKDFEVEAFINTLQKLDTTASYYTIEELIEKLEESLLSIYNVKFLPTNKSDDNTDIISSDKYFELDIIESQLSNITPEMEKFIRDVIIIGYWNDKSEYDKEIITEFSGEDINNWEFNLKYLLHHHKKILYYNSGHWKINNRKQIFLKYSDSFLDSDLDKLKSIAVKVLKETEPMFELNPENRYAASIYGKTPKYSTAIKNGISEILALLAVNEEKISMCTNSKVSQTINSIINELFIDSDWKLWASLNEFLPVLAEAAPEQFMNAVTSSLTKSECPFDELFKQEGKGITGWNYMTGLYWALERLAWSENYFINSMSILAELATHDPGGKFINRPENSIIMILLPWFPHTLVSFEKRLNAMKIIRKDFPDIAFKILLQLLPDKSQATNVSNKPRYRNPVDKEWDPKISNVDYYNHCNEYAKITLELAMTNKKYLLDLLNNIDNIPKERFQDLFVYLLSDKIVNTSEEDRFNIWEKLDLTIHKHRKYRDAYWAFSEEIIEKLQDVINKIKPNNPKYLYRQLFSNNDHFYFSEDDNWEKYMKEIEGARTKALQEVYRNIGVNGILEFAFSVEDKYKIGFSLWAINDKYIENIILPEYLDSTDITEKQLVKGYINGCFSNEQEIWINNLDFTTWKKNQICSLLLNIAYHEKIWYLAETLLGDSINIFWEKIYESPHAMYGDLIIAIDNLMKYNRPLFAAEIIYVHYYRKKGFLKDKALSALILGISSDENINSTDKHYIAELITLLQNEKEVDQDKLFQIEWAYLDLLDIHYGKEAITLHKYLSTEPSFLLNILKLLYKSDKEDETKSIIKEKSQVAINNAWQLLHEWKNVPGVNDNNIFSESFFMEWFNKVKEICAEEGYLYVAMYQIGKILYYTPKDENGFWINKKIAQLLDEKESGDLRSGYCNEVYNSRGAHFVDETGSAEKNIAKFWRERSKELENEGFTYFAASIKEIADRYEYEAKRTKSQFEYLHNNED